MGRNPALFTLWGGEFASRIGISLFQVILLWYLLERTGSPGTTGLVTMLTYLPAVMVGLWAGVIVDRLDYRRVMLGANLLRIVLAAAIPLLYLAGGLSVALIAMAGFVLTSATAFFNPSRDAIIPLLARKRELMKANSLVQSAWQFSLVIGPVLFAATQPFMPTVFQFFGVSLAFGVSALVLLGLGFRGRLRSPISEGDEIHGSEEEDGHETVVQGVGDHDTGAQDTDSSITEDPARKGESFLAEFLGGLAYLRQERRVFWIWVITMVNNFFLMGPVFVGIPVYVKDYLGGTGSDYGLIEGIYAGGMIVSTWLIAKYGDRFDPFKVLFLAIIYDGLTYLPLLWVTTVQGTLLTIVIHSLGIPAITISRITALHRIVPQAMQGRVFSYFNLAVDGMTALSIGLVGIVLTVLPSNQLFAIIGVLAASTGVLGLSLSVFRRGR